MVKKILIGISIIVVAVIITLILLTSLSKNSKIIGTLQDSFWDRITTIEVKLKNNHANSVKITYKYETKEKALTDYTKYYENLKQEYGYNVRQRDNIIVISIKGENMHQYGGNEKKHGVKEGMTEEEVRKTLEELEYKIK